LIKAFDLPKTDNNFYINILGAVLLGIGIALHLERFRGQLRGSRLGIAGAIAIKLCGSGALIAWLLLGISIYPLVETSFYGALR